MIEEALTVSVSLRPAAEYNDDEYPMPPDVLADQLAALESPDEPSADFEWWRSIRRPAGRGCSREVVRRYKRSVRGRAWRLGVHARPRHPRRRARRTSSRKVATAAHRSNGGDDPGPPARWKPSSDVPSVVSPSAELFALTATNRVSSRAECT